MNNKLFITLVLASLVCLVSGCASSPQQQNTAVSAVPPVQEAPAQAPEPSLYPAEPELVPEQPRVVVQEPRVVENNQNPALDSLVDQALAFLSARDYPRAINTAERAMSIDRYDPRVYLLLAQAHRLSGNLALSRQYAERGLAISQADSDTARALERLR